ncbi:hypothetical protein Dimus_003658 [Dionaea muscipula]
MASSSKSTARKSHSVIPEDMSILNPEPLAIDRSSQRPVSEFSKEMSTESDEVRIISEKKEKEDDTRWLGSGANRRRDEGEDKVENEEEVASEEIEEENIESDLEKTVTDAGGSTPTGFEWEEAAEVQEEQNEEEAKTIGSISIVEYFDVMDEERIVDEGATTPAAQPDKQKKKSTGKGVDPSGSLPDYDLLHLQVEFAKALQVNSRFQELYQKMKPNILALPKP